jgi:hypothetical protein
LGVLEAASGCLSKHISIPFGKNRQNLRFIASQQHLLKYDCFLGSYTLYNRVTGSFIIQLTKRPPLNSFINCSCASKLPDGMFFFAYEDPNPTHGNSIHAVFANTDTATMCLSLATDYKNSGFTEKPQGKIVSLHCHPTKQILFVVYSRGTMQVLFNCFLMSSLL